MATAIGVLASLVTILDFFLGLYLLINDRPLRERHSGASIEAHATNSLGKTYSDTSILPHMTAGRRLAIILGHALLVGGFWGIFAPILDEIFVVWTEVWTILLISSGGSLSFWLALRAPSSRLAFGRAILSGSLCTLVFFLIIYTPDPDPSWVGVIFASLAIGSSIGVLWTIPALLIRGLIRFLTGLLAD